MAFINKTKVSGNAFIKKHDSKGGRKGGFRGGKGGFGGVKGAAKGGGGGQWMFIPAGHTFGGTPPHRSFGKGGHKSGKGGAAKGAMQNPQQKKSLDKIGKIDAEKKVWVGGLSKDAKRGAVYALFKETCKPHMFELMSKGTACVAFKTADDAQLAIDCFNGSDLDGSQITVDVWTKKEKTERPKKTKKPVIKTSFLKSKKGKTGEPAIDDKLKAKIKAVDHSLKVWVGGLSESTTWKQLKQHFVEKGCEVHMTTLMKPGTACVTFKTEEEATSAVGSMSGTDLDGNTLTVDVWTKPERKEKKKKEEKL